MREEEEKEKLERSTHAFLWQLSQYVTCNTCVITIQWSFTIKDTMGDLHFVLYRGVVSLTKGLCVIHFIDHQYYLCISPSLPPSSLALLG